MRYSAPTTRSLVAALLICFTAGCTAYLEGILYNNSGADRVLTTGSKRYNWPAGKTWRGYYPFWDGLTISNGNESWRYATEDPPWGDWVSKGFGPAKIQLQLEPDGSLYLLKPDAKPPVKEFPPQPTALPPRQPWGFPLRPLPPTTQPSGSLPSAAVWAMREKIAEQYPKLTYDQIKFVRTTEPKMTGHYNMSANFGQYFFEWSVPDGSVVRCVYEGSLTDPNARWSARIRVDFVPR